MSALRSLAAACLAAVALTSCVDIEMRFVMRRDGAGRLELSYRVPREAATLMDPVEGVPAVPLPIERADFEASLAGADGVRLRRFRRTDQDEEVRIEARIDFDSIDALRAVPGFADLPVSFTATGAGGGELSQRVVPARPARDAPDERMVEFVQAHAGDSRVTFVVVAPRDIQAADGGTIDTDRRTARFSRSLADYLTEAGPVDLTVRW